MRASDLAFTIEPTIVVPLAAIGAGYAIGVARLWRAAGNGQGVRWCEAAAFAAGWLALLVALVGPLDALSEKLFAVHMVQHELLMIVAAPLIAAGAPIVAFAWLLPARRRRLMLVAPRWRRAAPAWAILTAPVTVWLLHAVALWVWHLPVLFEAALENDAVHAAQHISFFGTAVLFWWGIAHGRYGRLSYGTAVLYTFATAVHSGVLGALLTFAPHVWYPTYLSTTTALGVAPLDDQQLGGLIMWVPAGVVYTGVGLVFFAAWIKESERRTRYSPSKTTRRVTPFVSVVFLVSMMAVASSACTDTQAYHDAETMTGGSVARGRDAIVWYGCDSCHTVPGVKTARGLVGPPLTQIAGRVYLAGHLPNTPENMQMWIRHPRTIEPHTAMPDTGVTEEDARDIAAYLYTLR